MPGVIVAIVLAVMFLGLLLVPVMFPEPIRPVMAQADTVALQAIDWDHSGEEYTEMGIAASFAADPLGSWQVPLSAVEEPAGLFDEVWAEFSERLSLRIDAEWEAWDVEERLTVL